MKEIKLTRGKVVVIDDEDFAFINQWKWTACKNGNTWYARRSNKGIYMHRVIMNATSRNAVCDHINGDGLNNQKRNLRITNKSFNAANRRTPKSANNTSRYFGVTYLKKSNRWRAYIVKNYRQTSLGCYDTAEKAALAYNKAAKEVHGEFAKTNLL